MNNLKAYQATVTENQVKLDCIRTLLLFDFMVIRVNSGAKKDEYENRQGQLKKRFTRFVTWLIPGLEPQIAGVSDILALAPWGEFWTVECKRPGKLGNVSPPQRTFQQAAGERGAVCIVTDNAETLEQEIVKRKR